MSVWFKSVRAAVLGGTAALALAAVPGAASAQTIEELRRQLEILTRRIDELEAQQKAAASATQNGTAAVFVPTSTAVAQSGAEVAQSGAAVAQAGAGTQSAPENTVESGNDRIRVTLSGQINRALLYGNNGTDSQLFHVDNDNSSTRVRFVGEGDVTDDFTVGTAFEVELQSNSSNEVDFGQTDAVGGFGFNERKLEVYFDSKAFGRFWVGQGDTASNGTSEVDLSGTTVVNYSLIDSMAGGLSFEPFGPGLLRSDPINQVFSNFDGLSRDDRLRYDTPNFGGFKVSASIIEGDQWDVAGLFAGEVGETRIATAIGYANGNDGGTRFDRISGSASVLLSFGLNFTGALGGDNFEGATGDPSFWYLKLGQQLEVFDIGKTNLAVDITETKDLAVNGDTARSYGLFGVQNWNSAASEFYLGVRNHELDPAAGPKPSDVLAVMLGARVKF